MAVSRLSLTGHQAVTYNAIAHQEPPTRWRPHWTVARLVYQGGHPILPKYSLTGGGFIPVRTFRGRELPSWQPYATPTASLAAGGQLPVRPLFLTALGGATTSAQF